MTQYEKDLQNNLITSDISFLLDIKTKQAFSFRLRYPMDRGAQQVIVDGAANELDTT